MSLRRQPGCRMNPDSRVISSSSERFQLFSIDRQLHASLFKKHHNTVVGNLRKIGIEGANGVEIILGLKANQLIDFGLHLQQDVGWSDRNRQNDALWIPPAQGCNCRPCRCAGCYAVVDENCGPAFRGLIAAFNHIQSTSAFNFPEFFHSSGLDIIPAWVETRCNCLVNNDFWFVPVHNSTKSKFRLRRSFELAHEHDIQRRLQRLAISMPTGTPPLGSA